MDIKLNRVDRVYKPGDSVAGVVVVTGPLNFSGIVLTVEGTVTLQLSARSVGLFEAFYSSLKPLQLMRFHRLHFLFFSLFIFCSHHVCITMLVRVFCQLHHRSEPIT
jgi:hypothetical protein